MANRVRTDPVLALKIYSRITSDEMREAFVEVFGVPIGAGRRVGKA
jgi:hypothetical protein